MTDLFAARSQMAISLGFHIVFAAIGVAMPILMSISHFKFLKTGDANYLQLTKLWSKGVAIFFATGAVSGTVLSFELGLLWPKFMEHAGAIIGMPFSWEGTAFFLEAIFIGIYLYGWNRINRWAHWGSGLAIGVSGVISAFFVICANGWMNTPTGFVYSQGVFSKIDPWAAMFNPAAWHEGLHMVIASFAATGFAVAGLHALALKKDRKSSLHLKALKLSLVVASVAALIQPLHGDRLAKQVARLQPIKLAAMESLFQTAQPASLLVGGIPSEKERQVHFGIHLPKLLSFLAYGDFNAEVKGLEAFPVENWPPVAPVHFSFQLMVALGFFLCAVSLLSFYLLWKKKERLLDKKFLTLLAACIPLGFLAMEAGWVVTEVGRQPWIIYNVMRTSEAVTPMPHLIYPMTLFSGVYLFLTVVVAWLLMRQFRDVK